MARAASVAPAMMSSGMRIWSMGRMPPSRNCVCRLRRAETAAAMDSSLDARCRAALSTFGARSIGREGGPTRHQSCMVARAEPGPPPRRTIVAPACRRPAMADDPRRDLKGTAYELFMFLLSWLAIANVVIVLLAGITSVAGEVAFLTELMITPFFLFDFLYRLVTSPARWSYIIRRFGWADLVAVVPFLRLFRRGRISAVVREARRVGFERLADDLYVTRAIATFLVTVFAVIVVVEFAGIAEFYVEQGQPTANIVSAGDSIWWGLVTITTVGYGDQYPVGPGGRAVGAFLLFAGIALFSV